MKRESNRSVIFAIGGNLVIAISKFVAAFYSGSSAMISEGIHSLVDTGDGLLLLLGRKRSKKPDGDGHDFGYGLELYFWTLIVAILIFALGGGMSLYEGISHLRNPKPLESVGISYIVLIVSFIAEGTSFTVAFKEFRKRKKYPGIWQSIRRGKDPTVFTILFEDSAALIGLSIAFVALFIEEKTGLQWVDGVASILIGLCLCGVALLLTRESKDLLLGESIRQAVQDQIRQSLSMEKNIETVLDFRSMHFGPSTVLLTIRVKLAQDFDKKDWQMLSQRVKMDIQKSFPPAQFIYLEPVF